MQIIKAILWIAFSIYALAFFLVGMCLLDATQEVSACRDNMAGQLIYSTVNIFRK